MSRDDRTRARFAATASKLAALGDRRIETLRARIRERLPLTGTERALDVGAGTGPLAFAIAPLVREVVAADLVPEMLEQARRRAVDFPNVTFVIADGAALPYAGGTFDVTLCGRTLHHVERPAAVVDELARVTRPGGRVLVIDQIAPADSDAARVLERIERLRDPVHERTLGDGEVRAMLAEAQLELERADVDTEERDLEEFLALGGCEGEANDAVVDYVRRCVADGRGAGIGLRAEGASFRFAIDVGWYVSRIS